MPGELEEKFVEGQWYEAKVEDAFTGESNGGTPCITLRWMITEGELTGKHLEDSHWINDNTKNNQRKAFNEALNYDIAVEDLELVQKLVGREASIKVKYEEFPKGTGKWNPKVDRMRKPGTGGATPAQRIAKFFGRNVEEKDPWDQEKDTKNFGT